MEMLKIEVSDFLEIVKNTTIIGLTGVSKILYNKYNENRKELKALKLGMVSQIHNEIVQAYDKYMEQGYIYIYHLENLENMYRQYKALGGNAVIDELMKELMQLEKRGIK